MVDRHILFRPGICLLAGGAVFAAFAVLGRPHGAATALAVTTVLLLAALLSEQRRFRSLQREFEANSERARKMTLALDHSPYGICVTEFGSSRPLYVNGRFADLMGTTATALVTGDPERQSGSTALLQPELESHLRNGHEWSGEIFYGQAATGGHRALTTVVPVADDAGNNTYVMALTEKLGEEGADRQRMFLQANYDQLTGLPNRSRSIARLHTVAERAQREEQPLSVAFVDLDRTKLINDSLGHRIADDLLVEVAHRLGSGIGPGDYVGNFGGDKFFLIFPGKRDEDVLPVISQLKQRIKETFAAGEHEIQVSASFGLATFPDDHSDARELLHCAESAMYSAKQRGGDAVVRYRSVAGNEDAVSRLAMESSLRSALERNEFRLYYQPIIDLSNNRLAGAEALLRWHSKRLGNPSPDQFISVAEETGQIAGIGDWVLREACRQAAEWRREGMPRLHVSVNISARQMENDHILFSVKDALEHSGLEPEQLVLEVTERLLVNNDEYTRDLLYRLRELGVRLSLDDFGTGYASLSYLKYYPFDMLKIDRSFIHDANHARDSRELTTAIISMAHSLGMKVVAEGVEHLDQRSVLRERYCDMAQGFLFSPPIAPEDFRHWAEQYQSVHIM